MKNGVEGRLTGGLGNQLFVFAAAYAQAKRLGVDLILDNSAYSRGDIRSMELPGFNHSYSTAHKSRGRQLLDEAFKRVVREKSFEFDESVNRIRPGMTMIGYFQSYKYFSAVMSEICELILNEEISQEAADLNMLIRENQFSVIHLRRGDYLEPKIREVHGTVTLNYIHQAVSSLRDMGITNKFLVFSDSPELAEKEILSLGEDVSMAKEPAGFSSFELLRAFASAQGGFVMSNSSLSWWGATLSEYVSGTAVVCPDPWFANGPKTKDLLMPNWTRLDSGVGSIR